MEKETILKLIDDEMSHDPSFIGELFQMVSSKWEQYKLHIESTRKREHYRSLIDTLHVINFRNKKFKELELPFLIDAVKFIYPNGYDSAGSSACISTLDKFVICAKECGWSPDDNFIKKIRNFGPNLEMLYKQYEERAAEGKPVGLGNIVQED